VQLASRRPSVIGLCVGKELRGTVALCKGLLGDELVGETPRFRPETVAPARDLTESVVASLQCALRLQGRGCGQARLPAWPR